MRKRRKQTKGGKATGVLAYLVSKWLRKAIRGRVGAAALEVVHAANLRGERLAVVPVGNNNKVEVLCLLDG